MDDRIYKILKKALVILYYIILVCLFLKGEVFRVHTPWFCLTFTSAKNFVVIFIILWAVTKLKSKPHLKLLSYLLPLLLLTVVSVIFSQFPSASVKAAFTLLVYILWFYSIRDILKEKQHAVTTVILFISLSAIVNIINLYFHYSIGMDEILEKYPFWQGKNALGLFLVMSLCVSSALAIKREWKWCIVLNSLLLVFGIIFSYSRSAWIACVTALIGIAVFRFKRTLWILVGCVIVAVIISPAFLSNRINSIFSGEDTNVNQRIEVWRNTVHIIKEKPILGTGLGTFRKAYMSKFPDIVPEEGEGSRIIRHAHNLYLQILSETGIIGLAIFVFLIIAGLTKGIKCFINEQDCFMKSIKYGSLLGIFVFFVYSITDCTISWKFAGDSFSHINLIWIMLWVLALSGIREKEGT